MESGTSSKTKEDVIVLVDSEEESLNLLEDTRREQNNQPRPSRGRVEIYNIMTSKDNSDREVLERSLFFLFIDF